MKKQDLWIPIAMLALGAGIGFWTRDRQPQVAADATTPPVGATADVAVPGAQATQAIEAATKETPAASARYPSFSEMNGQTAPGFASALPPLDAKVADVYEQLRDRAARGDGRAACRLAAELQQCADRDFMLQGADRAAQMLDQRGQRDGDSSRERAGWESRRQAFAQQQIDFALQLDERCKGVTEAQLADQTDLWRRAALSGHVPSMVHYAKGDGFRQRATLDNLERLATYKSEAERLMRAAAAAGSAEAIQQLQAAYGESRNPWSGLLQQAVKPDAVEAGAIALLAEERGLPPDDSREPRWNRRFQSGDNAATPLTAVQKADAELRAAELRRQWPNTRPAPDARTSPWDRMQNARKACDQEQFTKLN